LLETAVEYGLLEANPATGRRRRLKSTRPARPWVEPEQLPAFLDAASGVGRVLFGLLAGAGLRIGEALALRWQHVEPDDHVVTTSTGRKHNPSNLRRDVLRPAVESANARLAKEGIAPIAESLGFHVLRRTYASLRCACGDDVAYASAQLGHEDPRFTLKVYAQATKRRERLSGPHLRAYDRALGWARMGTVAAEEALPVPEEATKNPA
jgi:integrase